TNARSTAMRMNWRCPSGSPGRQAPVAGRGDAWGCVHGTGASTESGSAQCAGAPEPDGLSAAAATVAPLALGGRDLRALVRGRAPDTSLPTPSAPTTSPPERESTLGVRPRLPDPVMPGLS